MPLTTYTAGQVLTAASLNSNFAVIGCEVIQASTTFTTASAVNVNNVFTAGYKKHTILIDFTAKSTSLQVFVKLRNAGTDRSTAYYSGMFGADYASAATVYGSRANNATSGFPVTLSSSSLSTQVEIDFFGATDSATTTTFRGFVPDTSNAYGLHNGGIHAVVAASDGFSIIASTGTISGSYTILGYK